MSRQADDYLLTMGHQQSNQQQLSNQTQRLNNDTALHQSMSANCPIQNDRNSNIITEVLITTITSADDDNGNTQSIDSASSRYTRNRNEIRITENPLPETVIC